MLEYQKLLGHVLENGTYRTDRTGTGAISVFGTQSRYNLQDGFPAVTTKKLHMKSIIHELLWFLKGDTNIQYLNDNGVSIWNEWADPNGDLGPVYGKQWRSWSTDGGTVDQIRELVTNLEKDPYSRRHVISAWNPTDIPYMALPPCHCLFQFFVDDENRLSCQLYQRSADVFLGVPFNIASYALLTMMIAQVCGYTAHEFVHTIGDAHLYINHIEQAKLQLTREPLELARMVINPKVTDIDHFVYEDFDLQGYQSHPAIKAAIAI